jgi:hypothetical protein
LDALPDDTSRLTSITAEQAELLGQRGWQPICLDGLAAIDEGVAYALCCGSGSLSLDGLRSISPSVARSLSCRKGDLHLNGIPTISVDAASAFTDHEGALSLGGLKTISYEVAKAIAKHKGRVYLHGLTELPEDAALVLKSSGIDISDVKIAAVDEDAAQSTSTPEIIWINRRLANWWHTIATWAGIVFLCLGGLVLTALSWQTWTHSREELNMMQPPHLRLSSWWAWMASDFLPPLIALACFCGAFGAWWDLSTRSVPLLWKCLHCGRRNEFHGSPKQELHDAPLNTKVVCMHCLNVSRKGSSPRGV